jgi:hypothetical protein
MTVEYPQRLLALAIQKVKLRLFAVFRHAVAARY